MSPVQSLALVNIFENSAILNQGDNEDTIDDGMILATSLPTLSQTLQSS